MNNVEEKLKQLILSRYRSLREFSIDIDMPYSTLDSVLKRGISKSSIASVLKICSGLNIDADSLANGEIDHKSPEKLTTINNSNISSEKIELYQHLNDAINELNLDKKDIETLIDIAKRMKGIE